MKGHSRESTAKKLSCSISFHGDIFQNVSYPQLKGWEDILEVMALLSTSICLSRVPEHPQTGTEGSDEAVWSTDAPVEEKEELLASNSFILLKFLCQGYTHSEHTWK